MEHMRDVLEDVTWIMQSMPVQVLECAATELLVQGNTLKPMLSMNIIPGGAAAETPSPTACATLQAQDTIPTAA
jgi:hypothetical protein